MPLDKRISSVVKICAELGRDEPFLKEGAQLFFSVTGISFTDLKLGMRDLKAGQDSGLKVCLGGAMPKITLGITVLHEIEGWDLGIEEPYWEPS